MMADQVVNEVHDTLLKALPNSDGFAPIRTGPKDKTRVLLIDKDGAISRGYFDPVFGGGRWCVADERWFFAGKARSIVGWKTPTNTVEDQG